MLKNRYQHHTQTPQLPTTKPSPTQHQCHSMPHRNRQRNILHHIQQSRTYNHQNPLPTQSQTPTHTTTQQIPPTLPTRHPSHRQKTNQFQNTNTLTTPQPQTTTPKKIPTHNKKVQPTHKSQLINPQTSLHMPTTLTKPLTTHTPITHRHRYQKTTTRQHRTNTKHQPHIPPT